ncbi:MAG: hypothetical protein WC683_02440 [bacterium]
MSRMGIFTALNGAGFGGFLGLGLTPAEQYAATCKQNCENIPGTQTVAECQADCDKFTAAAVTCAPACAQFRQDSNEWVYCIQKCHGLTPSQAYDEAQKSLCSKQGMTYSWLENKCVDTNAYKSCPAGTVYAIYPDGNRCIGINTDLTKTTCPAGTSLKIVPSTTGGPSGQACVSPVTPTPAKKTPVPVKPNPVIVGDGGGGGGTLLAGMGTGWMLVGVGALALIGIVVLAKKKKKPLGAAPNRRRRRR